MIALGLIETVGYTTAVSAADAAVKAADVEIVGLEKVIGVSGYVSVTVHLSGDVAAVTSAVEAGEEAARTIGQVVSTEVIARAHSDVQEKLLSQFKLNPTEPDEEGQKQDSVSVKEESDKKESATTKKAGSNKKNAKNTKKDDDSKKA